MPGRDRRQDRRAEVVLVHEPFVDAIGNPWLHGNRREHAERKRIQATRPESGQNPRQQRQKCGTHPFHPPPPFGTSRNNKVLSPSYRMTCAGNFNDFVEWARRRDCIVKLGQEGRRAKTRLAASRRRRRTVSRAEKK